LQFSVVQAEYQRRTGKALTARVFDIGIWTITSGGCFAVPLAIGSLVLDHLGAPGHALFGSRAPCRRKGDGVISEGFGKYAIDGVSPTAIMLNDFVGDMRHLELVWFFEDTRPSRAKTSTLFYDKMDYAKMAGERGIWIRSWKDKRCAAI
jgi:hypothetical protein